MNAYPLLFALSMATAPLTVIAQDNDPFAPPKPSSGGTATAGSADVAQAKTPVNLEVRYESFSLPLATAAKLNREALPDSELYARIVRMLDEGKVRQERFTVIRVPSGQKGTTESVKESIHATEFEPPELPNMVGVQLAHPGGKDVSAGTPDPSKLERAPRMEDLDTLRTPATPTAFETRLIGHTFEVEATLQSNSKAIHLVLAPGNTVLAGESIHGQGLAKARMPIVDSQSLSLQAIVFSGVPHLLGTVSRSPVSKVDPDSAKTTWFAFVTARPVIPE